MRLVRGSLLASSTTYGAKSMKALSGQYVYLGSPLRAIYITISIFFKQICSFSI